MPTNCPTGRPEDGFPHDFADHDAGLGAIALIYCRRCGEVRELARSSDARAEAPVDGHSVLPPPDLTLVGTEYHDGFAKPFRPGWPRLRPAVGRGRHSETT